MQSHKKGESGPCLPAGLVGHKTASVGMATPYLLNFW